jgi:enterochelin esterase family protein
MSPEILPDNRVIFRIAATNAQSVGVFVDWMKTGSSESLRKDGAGVWSATLGPVKPGIYIYNFIVDGMSIADPVNPKMKIRARTSASLMEVPGKPAEFWEFRDVPHGKVEINFHRASTLGGKVREVWVYTPPGYERESSRKYPVLYLLHGSNDTPAGWTTAGRANFTMDNLLAEKAAREMIIVTPFGHAVPIEARDPKNTQLFEEYLLAEVIPMIEQQYRVAPGRKNRAIAGFSMGGGHALQIGLGHLDLFSSVVALSPGVPSDFEKRFASFLNNSAEANRKLDLFWIACGKDDFLFEAAGKLSATLDRYGIKHTYSPSEGAHTFNVWRGYFHEFAPLLFRAEQ